MQTISSKRILTHVAVVLASILFAATIGMAAPGDPDMTFGSGGRVFTNIVVNEPYPWAESMLVQPDGKILVAGILWHDGYALPQGGYIVRYLPNGTLDPLFGQNGKVFTWGGGSDLALRPDGRILVAPRSQYSSSGVLDGTFGNDSSSCGGEHIALLPDGKMLGTIWEWWDSAHHIVVNRCNTNGSLDTTFGTAGEVRISDGISDGNKVLVQPDGRIIVVGSLSTPQAGDHTLLARFNPGGTPDSSFGNNGRVVLSTDGLYPYSMAATLMPDGKILVARQASSSFLVRFNPNGSIDTGFGTNGFLSFPFFTPSTILPSGDGKIVLTGNGSNQSGVSSFGIARLHSNGALDPTFGVGGRSLFPMNAGGSNYAFAIPGSIQPDGKILAAGAFFNYYSDSHEKIALLRVNGGRRSVFDFDGDGRADISVFRPSDRVWYLNRSSQGFYATQFGLSTDKITPADHDGDGKADISVYRDGVWYWLKSSDNSFNAVQFGLSGDVPVPADYTGDGRAELAIYRRGAWWTLNLANNQTQVLNFGLADDKPVPADYDGDGRIDQAVYRNGEWHINGSSQGYFVLNFGLATDRPVPSDYDGDGKADVAVYRNGEWHINRSMLGYTVIRFGLATDIPTPADYDGDGRTDIAVFRDGVWYLLQTTGGFAAQQFGLANDQPVPSAFLP